MVLSVKRDYEYLFLPLPIFAHTVYEIEWGISYDICKLYLEEKKKHIFKIPFYKIIVCILISFTKFFFNTLSCKCNISKARFGFFAESKEQFYYRTTWF